MFYIGSYVIQEVCFNGLTHPHVWGSALYTHIPRGLQRAIPCLSITKIGKFWIREPRSVLKTMLLERVVDLSKFFHNYDLNFKFVAKPEEMNWLQYAL